MVLLWLISLSSLQFSFISKPLSFSTISSVSFAFWETRYHKKLKLYILKEIFLIARLCVSCHCCGWHHDSKSNVPYINTRYSVKKLSRLVSSKAAAVHAKILSCVGRDLLLLLQLYCRVTEEMELKSE